MELSRIIGRSWGYVKHNRALWWLGILALFTEGGYLTFPPVPPFPSGSQPAQPVNYTSPITSHNLGAVVALVLVGIAVAVLIIYLSLAAKAGLILAINAMEDKKAEGKRLNFRVALRRGRPFAWRLLGLNLLLTLALLLLLAIFGLPVAVGVIHAHSTGNWVALTLAGILAFLIVLAGGIALIVLRELGNRFIVLEDMRIVASLRAGYKRLRARLNDVFIAWLVSVGLGFIATLAFIAFITLFVFAAFLIGALIGVVLHSLAVTIFGVLAGILFVMFAFTLLGYITGFLSSYWTLVYRGVTS